MKIRKAVMPDIPALLKLINGYAAEGIMLPRTEFEMAESLRDFTVVEEESRIIAGGALHFYTPETGEIRSVAVDRERAGTGSGRALVGALETEAQAHAIDMLFAFTYVPGFFEKLGYEGVDRSELPLKAWKDCLRCPKFQCCDEIAMVKYIAPLPGGHRARRAAPEAELQSIALPVLKK